MAREDDPSILGRLQALMEDEMGSGKLITYGIASAGLLAALYKIRPFAKFTKPSDIPLHFLQSRVSLQGTVQRVEPSSTKVLLMVDHRPLVPFPRFNKAYLPVKIGGVDITGNGKYQVTGGINSCYLKQVDLVGVSWLQTVLDGKIVTFLPIIRERDYVECVVTLPEKNQSSLEIGEQLVKLGLATVHEPWMKLKDKHVLTYKSSLAKAQKWAIRRRNGYWHFVKQPTILWKAQMFMIEKMKTLLPTIVVRWLDL